MKNETKKKKFCNFRIKKEEERKSFRRKVFFFSSCFSFRSYEMANSWFVVTKDKQSSEKVMVL